MGFGVRGEAPEARVARAKGVTDFHDQALPSSGGEGGQHEGD
jgi:hypothetical protein